MESKSLINKVAFKHGWVLTKEFTYTDFKLRYHDSALGYLWSVLRPLALFTIYYLVFSKIFKVGDSIPHYPVYLLSGIMIWNYFTEVTTTGVTAIVSKGDLLRKLDFPKLIILISKSAGASINLLINIVVIAIFMLIFGTQINFAEIWLVPFLVIELMLFGFGVSLILSTLYVSFRDLGYIWEVIIQALFYATPLLYPLSFVVKNFSPLIAKIMLLNPVAQIAQDLRTILVTKQTTNFSALYHHNYWQLVPILIVIIVLSVGMWYFQKKAKSFAEYI
jgi:ABC-2 type transport system permease protein